MYNSQEIANRIKDSAKNKGITIKALLESCELGVNTVGKMSNGTDVTSQTLVKIADCLDVSLDYLCGRPQYMFDAEVQKNNASDIRSVVINKVISMSEPHLDRLLGYLERLEEE